MTHKNAKTQLLRDLNKRMQARSNGVLALFRQAGFEQPRPDVKTLYTISQVNEDIYNAIIKLIYEDGESANALGWADWAQAGSEALGNFFGSVSDKESGKGTKDSEADKNAAAEAKAKAEADAKKTKTITVVIVVVVIALLAVGVAVFLKRKK